MEHNTAIIEAAMKVASAKLKSFPRLANGLTPDAVKATPEWKEAKSTYRRLFAMYREANSRKTRR